MILNNFGNKLTPDSQALFLQLPILHSMSNRQRSPSNAQWNILGAEVGSVDGLLVGFEEGSMEADGVEVGVNDGRNDG